MPASKVSMARRGPRTHPLLARAGPAPSSLRQTSGLSQARLTECCGPDARPPAASMAGCITDINAWNQDKTAVAPTCAAVPLPAGGPGATNTPCGAYSSAVKSPKNECEKAFCAMPTTTFGRRLRADGAR
jgi:hypothetical protein